MADGRYDIDVSDGFARIYAWLRYSATRKLTWQRNYNTQPRILSGAQDRLTGTIASTHSKTRGVCSFCTIASTHSKTRGVFILHDCVRAFQNKGCVFILLECVRAFQN